MLWPRDRRWPLTDTACSARAAGGLSNTHTHTHLALPRSKAYEQRIWASSAFCLLSPPLPSAAPSAVLLGLSGSKHSQQSPPVAARQEPMQRCRPCVCVLCREKHSSDGGGGSHSVETGGPPH